ncbi:putative alpha-glucosidase [Lineolata rhizophorae]|uniref:Probable alpha/beta-glucosidase agdC n=1 Tax=Lineolata rhizophorae TaxID=578093 RepID=A0A6A6NLN2_9PEZI|nr:putative alpha-glucosidase [Lineolata rhizophorae]
MLVPAGIALYLASTSAAPTNNIDVLDRRQLPPTDADVDGCPGYTASNVVQSGSSFSADLTLAGDACNAYGDDIEELTLSVTYETDKRLHVLITDAAEEAYRVPTSVFPRPESQDCSPEESDLEFDLVEDPFSFSVKRRHSGEVLFDSSVAPLVFEDQYLRLRTALPEDPNLYGLGEHADNFRLNTTNYTRTLWSRDSYGIPEGTNLYGNHPVYFDHRGENGTHGVFMLASNGMDVKINRTEEEGQYLEYNIIGGVLDLYYLAGDSPSDVSREYAGVAGVPAMQSYWTLGFHNCRYGYRDFYAVAEAIYNYSAAGIPLETMWTDIDYMYERYVFTTDPERFPVPRMRDIVDYLHEHDQHYIVMVDPAVAYQDYHTFNHGVDEDVFMKFDNGTIYKGVVWPGPSAFPDWFHPNTQGFWNLEFANFFDPATGIDIDGLWIDMNEAANFCPFPCLNPNETAEENGNPPERPFVRSQPRPIPGFPPEFQPGASDAPPDSTPYNDPWLAPPGATGNDPPAKHRRQLEIDLSAPLDTPVGIPGRDLLAPPYRIGNEATYQDYGGLSNMTIRTDLHHYNGLAELDTHNLYGTMMSETSRGAMLERRPAVRPLVITRSTFAGIGHWVGKWLGDNLSTWEKYRQSIQGMLDFSALYQVPMVGSDVCGFGNNATETLCARWAMLGAFYPFYRDHNQDNALPQEFYIWESVTEAAKKAIDVRYRLLDYFYTAMYDQSVDGSPSLLPMYFLYPGDANTFANALQFFYGPAMLVSPVTEENATSVEIYLPDDVFYDFYTHEVVQGAGASLNLTDVGFTDIPLHVRGGCVVPLRTESGMTTKEVRTKPFELLVAPGRDGVATGSLYLDDGDSIVQDATSYVEFAFANGCLTASGSFDYTAEGAEIAKFTVLGVEAGPSRVWVEMGGEAEDAMQECAYEFDGAKGELTVTARVMLTGGFSLKWE